ncbi:hypothetical protein G7046_g4312 [Stylonectria norvegica]|nr:hypothetical protein G7046_g4312 [Stylonectria norvegica]
MPPAPHRTAPHRNAPSHTLYVQIFVDTQAGVHPVSVDDMGPFGSPGVLYFAATALRWPAEACKGPAMAHTLFASPSAGGGTQRCCRRPGRTFLVLPGSFYYVPFWCCPGAALALPGAAWGLYLTSPPPPAHLLHSFATLTNITILNAANALPTLAFSLTQNL